jgi:type IV secretory pathway VirB3-like protein
MPRPATPEGREEEDSRVHVALTRPAQTLGVSVWVFMASPIVGILAFFGFAIAYNNALIGVALALVACGALWVVARALTAWSVHWLRRAWLRLVDAPLLLAARLLTPFGGLSVGPLRPGLPLSREDMPHAL